MSALAKTDVHLRAEGSAFEYFFKALRRAMLENGDWDGKSDIIDAYIKRVPHFFPARTLDMEKCFPLGFDVEQTHNSKTPITLTEVIAMKNYCDSYFLTLARDYEEKRTGQKLEFVMESRSPIKSSAQNTA